MSSDVPDPTRRFQHWQRSFLLRREFHRHRKRRDGVLLNGHHNHNYVVHLDKRFASMVGAGDTDKGKFRTRMQTVEVLLRAWQDEGELLTSLRPHLRVPRRLLAFGEHSLHDFTRGTPLSEWLGPRGPVDEDTMGKLAAVMRRIASVPPEALPALPGDWPQDGDSPAFLRRLAAFAEKRVYERYRDAFGTLFDALGITEDAVTRFDKRAAELRPRPFRLLHTDLHRDNILCLPGDEGELFVLDWEIALFGDPLHELATHLVRMGYPQEQQERMKELWQQELSDHGMRELTDSFDDLATYLDFERAQSVYPDTMRTALSLYALPAGERERRVPRSAARLRQSLLGAKRAAGLTAVPPEGEVAAALRSWLERQSRYGRHLLRHQYSAGVLPPLP